MQDDASELTLSVVVNAHGEGALLRPTMRSVAAAAEALQDAGATCEIIIVLDCATPSTLGEAARWTTSARTPVMVRSETVHHGDPGASRNSGAQAARGRYVAFCDGDDLVSVNYFTEAVALLDEAPGPLIIHPATVVSFGARSAIWRIPSSEDVDHLQLIRDNLWPSSSVSRRTTYLETPYRSVPPESGFGPEDWLWNIETSIARVPHRPAVGTYFFYRIRESGGVNNRHSRSILPAYDLEGLVAALPAKVHAPRLKEKRTASSQVKLALRSGYRFARPAIRVVFSRMNQGTKERLYARGVALYRRQPRNLPAESVPPTVVEHLRRAAELEPAISWTANGYLGIPEWLPHDDGYAQQLIDIVASLRGSRAVVAVPWVGVGGADLVSLNYVRALAADPRFEGGVTMLATYLPERTLRHLVPADVGFVQVSQRLRDLTPNQQRRILAQAILIVGPELVVSVNCFDVTNSLQFFSRPLTSTARIYLTLFAWDRIGDGYPVNPITDDSQRTYLDDIAGIITDNTVTAGLVTEMLALDNAKVRVHYQPALETVPGFRPGTRAYNNRFFSERNPFVVVWPHRLDKEKRPDSLIAIAERLRALGLPVRIIVHGQQVLSGGGAALMAALAEAGVEYRGPYSGGLPALPTHEYHALLLTSESEGLPLVLVQSMLLGVPVIAANVGGVSDIVRHGETGLLVSGPDDAEGFVTAIRRLMDSLEERQRIIRAAYDFAVAQHGSQRFGRLVADL